MQCTAASAASIASASIISMAAGTMPAEMIAEVAAPAWSVRLEADEDRAHLLGQPDQPDGRRGDDAERALGADDGAEQVVAGAVGGGAAERDDVALRR